MSWCRRFRDSVVSYASSAKYRANRGSFCGLLLDLAATGLTVRAVNDNVHITYTTTLLCEDVMLTQGTGFAKYSKSLCWIVAIIWLALSILAFTSGGENSTINGFLGLAGAIAFAVSASLISRSPNSAAVDEGEE